MADSDKDRDGKHGASVNWDAGGVVSGGGGSGGHCNHGRQPGMPSEFVSGGGGAGTNSGEDWSFEPWSRLDTVWPDGPPDDTATIRWAIAFLEEHGYECTKKGGE